jgi:hypothetical protein
VLERGREASLDAQAGSMTGRPREGSGSGAIDALTDRRRALGVGVGRMSGGEVGA